jgi:hypothetical protein
MISLRKTNTVIELSRKTGWPTSWRVTVTAFASIAVRTLAGVLLKAQASPGPRQCPLLRLSCLVMLSSGMRQHLALLLRG